MLDVARHDDGTPVSLATVAARTDLSRAYLEQLAIALRNSRLLRGVCGKGGGYRLARPAPEITIRDIVEAAIGPINVVDCLEDPMTCMRVDFCECRPVYALINDSVAGVLEGFTLADLLDPSWMRDNVAALDEDREPAGVGPNKRTTGRTGHR